MRPLAFAVILMVTAFVLSACGTPRRSAALMGDPEPPNEPVVRGMALYDRHCTGCHPGGEGGLGPSLNDKPAPAFLIKAQVRLGLGAMPRFSKRTLSSDELRDLVRYMIWNRHREKSENATPP